MVASGCFLAVEGDAAALVRDKTLFVLSVGAREAPALEFQLLTEPEVRAAVLNADAPDDENPGAQQHAVTVNCVSDVALFQPAGRDAPLALLVLVDERKLVHYDVDVAANAVAYRSLRTLPRNAVCMGIAHLTTASGDRKHVVLAGVKTGEALAMPFPDIARDTKTLLGHTTSMIVHLSVNRDSTLLLTADRDEKVRVSGFPRTSLVQSYCLGHTQSLTRVAASALTPELAVSTSLDNTLKLWGVMDGTLWDSALLLPAADERTSAKTLLHTSLAVAETSNVVAVALGYQSVRLFAIVTTGLDDEGADSVARPPPRLASLALPLATQTLLDESEPAEVAFTRAGVLVVAYRRAPFVRVFHVRVDVAQTSAIAVVESADAHVAASALAQLRATFATIEIEVAERVVDEFEDGLRKKKIRTDFTWKTKLATLGPSAKATNTTTSQ